MPNFQKIIDILSDAFSILDFSHIVSGVSTFLIITLALHLHDIHLVLMNDTLTVICSIFLAYVSGILSWIIGRWIRKKVQNYTKDFKAVFNTTKKAVCPTKAYHFIPIIDEDEAYTYMWIELNKEKRAKERVAFIHRFWVMQAMFEGLMTSCGIAIIATIELKISFCRNFPCGYFIFLLFFLLGMFCLCMNAAKENARNQIKEVIISYYSYIKQDNINHG